MCEQYVATHGVPRDVADVGRLGYRSNPPRSNVRAAAGADDDDEDAVFTTGTVPGPGCLQIQPNKFPADFQDTFNKVPAKFLH